MSWPPSIAVRAALAAALPIALLVSVIAVFHAASVARDNIRSAEGQLDAAIAEVDGRFLQSGDLPAAALEGSVADVVIVLREGVVESMAGPVVEPPPEVVAGARPASFQVGGDRYIGYRSLPGPPDDIEIVLAVPAPGPMAVLRTNLWRYLSGALGIIVLGGALVGYAVKRAMREVEELRNQVGGIEVGTEASHVTVPAGDDELTRLGITLNAMVDRIRASAEQLEGFAGDTAHELRNPLAAIRANLDLMEASSDLSIRRAASGRALAEVDRCKRLVDSLLVVATLERGDEGAQSLASANAGDVVIAAVEAVEQAHPTLAFDTTGLSSVSVRIEPAHLSIVVSNLLDNAARHTRSTVEVTSVIEGDRVVLAFADDGPGVPVQSRELIFERFRTGDEERHFGLGLPLARRLTERAGGWLAATDPKELGGARFVVDLPVGS